LQGISERTQESFDVLTHIVGIHLPPLTWGDLAHWWLSLTQVRFTEKDFEELTETIICGNRVGIIIWLDNPFGFLIEDGLAARSYRKFFEILWKTIIL